MKGIIFPTYVILLLFCEARSLGAQEITTGNPASHQLTLYVMKSIKPIDWDSPSSLYKSVRKGYVSKISRKNQYLLGHLVVRLESPVNTNPVYSGMASSSNKEKRWLVRREKVGLGILGAGLQGHLETGDTVIEKINKYTRLNKVAFIRYLINAEAAGKISFFLEKFRGTPVGGTSPSAVYGGVFWPRYENEGAGCTAFGMAMLDLAGILGEEQSDWKVNVNIPVNLIGGEFNRYNRVRNKTIVRSDSWYTGDPDSINAFVPFWIYDPNIIYDWVIKQREAGDDPDPEGYLQVIENNIPGLVSDRRNIRLSPEDPVFVKRKEPSVFIEQFNRKQCRQVYRKKHPDTPYTAQ